MLLILILIMNNSVMEITLVHYFKSVPVCQQLPMYLCMHLLVNGDSQ